MASKQRKHVQKYGDMEERGLYEVEGQEIKLLALICSTKDFALYLIDQRSPTFLAPGLGFVEDKFSMDRG